jgi:hypothetical protein
MGNDLSCFDSYQEVASCLHADGSDHIYSYGNWVHDITNCSDKLCQALYMSTDTNHVWIGWNLVANVNTCNGIQIHSSPVGGTSGQAQYDIHIHDNVVHDVHCSGIDIATIDPSQGPIEVYNNVIYHTGFANSWSDGSLGYNMACIYAPGIVNSGTPGTGTVQIYNNTLYDCAPLQPGYTTNGAFELLAGSAPGLRYDLRNNVVQSLNANEKYIAGDASVLTCTGPNDWYGNGGVPSGCSGQANVNPLFVAPSSQNFQLQASSPLVNAGSAVTNVTTDITGVSRPQGAAYDIGAYEYYSGTAPTPTCDLNGDGVVNATDVQMAINQALGLPGYNAIDLNGDGVWSVVDVQRVINASNGLGCRTGT